MCCEKEGSKSDSTPSAFGGDSQSMDSTMDSLLFDLKTLRAATNNFSDANKIGEGGFGAVYKVRTLVCLQGLN